MFSNWVNNGVSYYPGDEVSVSELGSLVFVAHFEQFYVTYNENFDKMTNTTKLYPHPMSSGRIVLEDAIFEDKDGGTYRLAGWSEDPLEIGDQPQYNFGETYAVAQKDKEEGKVFYGVWHVNQGNITYVFTGDVPPDAVKPLDETVPYGTAKTAPQNPEAIEGYTFSGWKAEGVTLGADGSFSMPVGDVTFTGVWEKWLPLTAMDINLVAGTYEDDYPIVTGLKDGVNEHGLYAVIEISGIPGLSFKHKHVSDIKNTEDIITNQTTVRIDPFQYISGTEFSVTDLIANNAGIYTYKLTLYRSTDGAVRGISNMATLTVKTAVQFDANTTGTVGWQTADSITVMYGEPYGALASITRAGYTFGGWYYDSECKGSAVTEKTIVTKSENHTLYAKWNPNTDIEYTVRYEDTSGKSLREAKIVTGQTMAGMAKETAPDIAGYTVDADTKELMLDASGNVIVFVYSARTDIEYVVRYEDVSGKTLAGVKSVSGQTMAATVEEAARDIAGYTVDAATKELILAASGNEIVFVYTANTDIEYTVRYVNTAGNELEATKTVSNQTMAVTVTETALVIAGYTADKTSKELELEAAGNVIEFVYSANTDIEYAVRYVDTAGKELIEAKTVSNQTMATTVTENSLTIPGYTVKETTKNLTLAASGNEIVFVYTADRKSVV
jgi:uncharacterized repeat protein (TIGR02543 family)